MKNTFDVFYNGSRVAVEVLAANVHTEYLVHLPEGDLHLRHTEDDEGAGRWIDVKTNNETSVSHEVGQLIEVYSVQHSEKE